LVTVSRRLVNVAETVLAAFIVTLQTLPAVLAQPVHEVKAEVEAAVAVSCTTALGANCPVQLCVQLIPGGLLTIVPAPAMLTRRAIEVKVTVTVLAVFMVTVQVGAVVGVQPAQLLNTEPCPGVAVSVA
jgi:hypothetical protein